MSRSELPSSESQNYPSSQYEVSQFKAEVFYERATNWGATPLRHIPEQNGVCSALVRRIDDWSLGRSSPLLTDYMRTVYYGRFHVRQERNFSAFDSRLNQTPYEQLPPEVKGRVDRSSVGLASIRDEVFVQNDLEMGSNELARKTHPFHNISHEYKAIESEIYEACIDLDYDTYVPDAEDRVKIRGSDIITFPHLDGQDNSQSRQAKLLFVTKKRTIVVMPHSDTVVMRRLNYILDLDDFAQFEPHVAKVLRSYDVNGMDPDEWSKKLTVLWRDIDASAPLINERTRSALKDMSTTYYTVNQSRIALIEKRKEDSARNRAKSEVWVEHIEKLRKLEDGKEK